MQFKVPQDVNRADKIVGPLTLFQLIIAVVGGSVDYAIFTVMSKQGVPFIFWFPPVLIVGALTIAFAFLKIANLPFHRYLALVFEKILTPSSRSWVKGADRVVSLETVVDAQDNVEMKKRQAMEEQMKSKQEKMKGLADIRNTLDTEAPVDVAKESLVKGGDESVKNSDIEESSHDKLEKLIQSEQSHDELVVEESSHEKLQDLIQSEVALDVQRKQSVLSKASDEKSKKLPSVEQSLSDSLMSDHRADLPVADSSGDSHVDENLVKPQTRRKRRKRKKKAKSVPLATELTTVASAGMEPRASEPVAVAPVEPPRPVAKPVAVAPVESPRPVVEPVAVAPVEPPRPVVEPVAVAPVESPRPVVEPVAVAPVEPPRPVVEPVAVAPVEPPVALVEPVVVTPVEPPVAIADPVVVTPAKPLIPVAEPVAVAPVEPSVVAEPVTVAMTEPPAPVVNLDVAHIGAVEMVSDKTSHQGIDQLSPENIPVEVPVKTSVSDEQGYVSLNSNQLKDGHSVL